MVANTLWVEKYRPKTIEDYVFKDDNQKNKVLQWVKNKDIPHCLFSGSAGVGKTTLAKVLLNELEINEYDILELNASRSNSVDDVRNTITNFIQMMPFGEFKVVLLDECLHEDTLVWVLRNNTEILIEIKNVNDEHDFVKSYNVDTGAIEWKSFKLLDKGEQEVYRVTLETGDVIVCTGTHKWYVMDDNEETKVVSTMELDKFGHILSPVYASNGDM